MSQRRQRRQRARSRHFPRQTSPTKTLTPPRAPPQAPPTTTAIQPPASNEEEGIEVTQVITKSSPARSSSNTSARASARDRYARHKRMLAKR